MLVELTTPLFSFVSCRVKMEWGKKENRIAVLTLHKCGDPPTTIFKLLWKLNITQKFIYRTIQRYNETLFIEDKPRTDRPRSVRTPAVIKARIARNPIRKQKLMTLQLNISRSSMKRAINEELGLACLSQKDRPSVKSALDENATWQIKVAPATVRG